MLIVTKASVRAGIRRSRLAQSADALFRAQQTTVARDAWGHRLSTCAHVRDPQRGGICYLCHGATGRPEASK